VIIVYDIYGKNQKKLMQKINSPFFNIKYIKRRVYLLCYIFI